MGRCLAWLLSRLGDSIHRGKHLTGRGCTARDLFANGKLPMTVAPEGAPTVTVKLSVPWNRV